MTRRTGLPTARSRYQRDEVRVAIVGVGNCASSFVQGVEYYKDADPTSSSRASCTSTSAATTSATSSSRAAFDIDADKVGKDLSEAIWSGQNNTIKFADVPTLGRARPARHDPRRARQVPEGEDHRRRPARPPTSSRSSRDPDRRRRLLPAGRLRAGDQVVRRAGARGRLRLRQLHPGVHRPRARTGRSASRRPACRSSATTSSRRSARRSCTARWRASSASAACAASAPASSTSAATWTSTTCSSASGWSRRRSRRPTPSPRCSTTSCPADDVYIGPSDYVPWLTDRKWAHIRIEGESFGDVPLNMELKLEVWDSPNSAGIVIDAVRCCKLALNNGIGGALDGPSSYLMKSPPEQVPDPSRARPTPRSSSPSTREAAKLPGARSPRRPQGRRGRGD